MNMENPDNQKIERIASLYEMLLDAWNMHDAAFFASQFKENGNVVGFDGSEMAGRENIESELSAIFQSHQTASYVSKIREIRILAPEVAILRAVAGMVPPGKTDINPAVNAIQTMIAVHDDDRWRIALFQNTPAQFDGRPELANALTEELRELITKKVHSSPS
jgi:uncharacterized protein (TIGR02246 family)